MFTILIFLSVFSGVLFSWSYLVSYLFVELFFTSYEYLYIVSLFLLIGPLSFIIGLLGCNIAPNKYFQRLYKLGAQLIGINAIAGMLSIGILIVSYLTNTLFVGYRYALIFILIVLAFHFWGIYASFHPVIRRYKVHIRKTHNWHGKSIVMIGDTHYGNIYGKEEARKLVEIINTLSGDILVIPGDFFDGPKIDYEEIVSEFKNITTRHGILFANGNHEEYRNTRPMLDALEAAHIKVLNNKSITIDGMIFAGVSYHMTESEEGLTSTLDDLHLDSESPTILLKHKPTLHKVLKKYHIDLVVSGHTHHGQMWPFSLITSAIYGKYSYGLHRYGMLTSITTSGVGTWGPPQRIGTRGEIVVIDIV